MSQRPGKRSRLAAEGILRFAQNDEGGSFIGSARRRDRVLTLSAERSEVGTAATRFLAIVLSTLLALTMLPAAGIQSAFADEPVARPAAVGGDVALSGFEGDGAAFATTAGTVVALPTGVEGVLSAEGLVYKKVDGGVALIGFESDGLEGALAVPERLNDGSADLSVVGVDIAESQVADGVASLTLPQSVNDVNTATLATAFPNLAAIEIAAPKASAPVAAGAAAIRAAYSSFGGVLYRNAWIAADSDASQTTLTKELVWAPPATVVARIPVECNSIAAGAFADAKDLKTVVCFGVMESIPQAQKADDGTITSGAFTDEQIQTVNVIVPQTGTVVPNGDHVSASVAVTDDSTMDIKREAWWKSGFASDRITLGEVYGSTTNTLPVTEEGVLETAEAEVAYAPETTQNSSSRKAGIEPPESAIPTPVPDDDQIDPSESGLVFTHLADMTLSVSWKGDPTATPAHLDIPAYATINGVTYPVTEIAPEAFKGAVFLTSVNIPETVKVIGDFAFEGCTNLAEPELPSALRTMANAATVEVSTPSVPSEESGTNHPTPSRISNSIEPFAAKQFRFKIANVEGITSWKAELSTGISGLPAEIVPGKVYTLSTDVEYVGLIRSGETASWVAGGGVIYLGTVPNATSNYSSGITLRPVFQPGYNFVSCALLGNNGLILPSGAATSALVYPADGNSLVAIPMVYRDTNTTYDLSPYAKDAEIKSWVGENYLTKAATNLENYYDKAAFNTISYNLDDGEQDGPLPTFYVNDADKLPTVPAPKKDGYEFTGWTWGSATTPNKDASGAFSAGGPVTLTAHWTALTPEAPASNYFYSEGDSFKGDGSDQQSVVAVRITQDEGKTLSKLEIKDNDKTGLLDKEALGTTPVIWVNGTEEAPGAAQWRPWGGTFTNVGLTDVGDGWYGFYVGIQIPQSAVNRDSIVATYGGGDYIASLVTLEYTFA